MLTPPTPATESITLLYLAGATLVAIERGPLFYTELPRIAVIDYLGVFILAGILWVIAKIVPRESPARTENPAVSE